MAKIPLGYNKIATFNGAAIGLGKGTKKAASAVVAAGGAGYKVNDTLADATGVPSGRGWQFRVASVDATGKVLTVTLDFAGYYAAASVPAAPSSTTANTGSHGDGNCTLTVTYTADAVPDGCTHAEITVTGGDAMWRDDGGTPTSVVGMLLKSATSSADEDKPVVMEAPPRLVSIIAVDASGILNVSFYGTHSAQLSTVT